MIASGIHMVWGGEWGGQSVAGRDESRYDDLT